MSHCRRCGRESVGELCQQCAAWAGPAKATAFDPYADLPEPAAEPTAGPTERRSARVAIGIGLGVVGLGAAVGLALLLGSGSADSATPVHSTTPTASATAQPTRSAGPGVTASAAPTVVVTVTAAPSPAPVASQPVVSTPTPPPDAPVTQPVEQEFTRFYPLSRGDSGYVVEALQGLLTAHGVRAYVDGDFGAATERAVRQWQAQQGLTVNGIVDDTTWATLTPRLDRGSSGSSVKVLQKLLTARGYTVAIDGDFGRQTSDAVVAFQSDRGLTVDGLVASQTWPALLS